MKGVPHYFKNGEVLKGQYHKMKDGSLHSGKTHTKTSKPLFHFLELPKAVQNKIIKKKVKDGKL